MFGGVGPVTFDAWFVDQGCLREQFAGVRGERHLGFEEACRPEIAQTLLADVFVDHCADAGHSGVQWNLPEPAVLIGLDEDVAVVGWLEVLGVSVVAEDSEVLEVFVPLMQVQLATEDGRLSAGVDEESTAD